MSRRTPLVTAILTAILSACGDDPGPRDLPARDACALAVVAGDYRSTTVSLLTADGSLCAPDVITSGSRPPGLLAALSGDVVLPFEPAADGLLRLIDRYPNAVLTTVDPLTSEVLAQLAISPDFASNPQDLAATARGLLLARLERSPAGDDGSDLLLLTEPPTAPSRIDLSTSADPGLDPMPTRFARAAGRLWIGLTHLAGDFSRAGPGRALALDATTFAPTHVLDLAPLQNCGTITSAAPTSGLWVVCSGLFRNSPSGPQREHSGLAWLSPDLPEDPRPDLPVAAPSPLTPSWSRQAADLHPPESQGRPLGFTLAALDDQRALVVALGDLASDLPDRLLLVDRAGPITTLAESGPFQLGAVLPLPSQALILIADADPRRPTIRRFTWPTDDAPARELAPIDASPTGLPPRHLSRL